MMKTEKASTMKNLYHEGPTLNKTCVLFYLDKGLKDVLLFKLLL